MTRLALVGVILLLWVPRIIHKESVYEKQMKTYSLFLDSLRTKRDIVETSQGQFSSKLEEYTPQYTAEMVRILGIMDSLHNERGLSSPWYYYELGNQEWTRGHYEQAYDYFKQAINLKGDFPKAFYMVGKYFLQKEDYLEAREQFQAALKTNSVSNDTSFQVKLLNKIAYTYSKNNRTNDIADSLYRQILKITLRNNYINEYATTLINLSWLNIKRDSIDVAQKTFLEAKRLGEELDDYKIVALTSEGLGEIAERKGDYSTAVMHHYDAKLINEQRQDSARLAISLCHLSYCYNAMGQLDQALLYAQQFLFISEKINYVSGQVESLRRIADIYKKNREFENAKKVLSRASTLANQLKSERRKAFVLFSMAGLYNQIAVNTGDFDLALSTYQKVREFFFSLGDTLGVVSVDANIGITYIDMKKDSLAVKPLENALQYFRKEGNQSNENLILAKLAGIYKRQGKYDTSTTLFEQVIKYSREKNLIDLLFEVLNNYGELLIEKKRYKAGVDSIKKAIRIRPREPEPYVSIAKGFVLMGTPDSALSYLKKGKAYYTKKEFDQIRTDSTFVTLWRQKELWKIIYH